MAWDANRNLIYMQRCQNAAREFKNLMEESARLREVFVQELQGGNVAFADTAIATAAEITTFQSYLSDFLTFHNGGGTLGNTPRGTSWTLPLTDTASAQ